MSERPVFSFIMPSYNSEKTIGAALCSIRSQKFDQSLIEVLVIDGGSEDSTRDIAAEYGASVIDNPQRLPEYAKRIGFEKAHGEYLVKMDTDEEFVHDKQLLYRYHLLKERPELKCLVANRLLPASKNGVSGVYLNLYGDPFTFFVYREKGSILETYSSRVTEKDAGAAVLSFGKDDVTPIGDGGTTVISADYLNEHFSEEKYDLSFVVTAFNRMVTKSGLCGCIPGDDIQHRSRSDLGTYLSKLRFRVVNNVFGTKDSGFTQREKGNPTMGRRKKLFVLYALSVVWPLADSIILALRHRDATMLLHFFYVYYVMVLIAWFMARKLLGINTKNKEYG